MTPVRSILPGCLAALSLAMAGSPARALGTLELVINEVMPDPIGIPDASGEWFEVTSGASLDLRGLVVEGSNGAFFEVTADEPVWIDPGQYLVFARSSDPVANGGLPRVDYTFQAVSLLNTGGSLSLRRDGVLIDTIDYTEDDIASGPGVALQRTGETTWAAPGNFVQDLYGDSGNRGTPGAANAAPELTPVPEPLTEAGLAVALCTIGMAWSLRGSQGAPNERSAHRAIQLARFVGRRSTLID